MLIGCKFGALNRIVLHETCECRSEISPQRVINNGVSGSRWPVVGRWGGGRGRLITAWETPHLLTLKWLLPVIQSSFSSFQTNFIIYDHNLGKILLCARNIVLEKLTLMYKP